jgi:hypothetical protein
MVLFGLACLAIGFGLGRWRFVIGQNQGEAAVRRLLVQRFPPPRYHLMNNLTLPTEDGSTQVDHVLISRYGIFVIEAKHYTGWLFANGSASTWTQVIYGKRYKFQNPIRQNHKHVKAVEHLLDFLPQGQVHSIVVFTGDATFKTKRPDGVIGLPDLDDHIESFDEEFISENRIHFCVGRLECSRFAMTRQTDIEHVAQLQRRFGDAAQ